MKKIILTFSTTLILMFFTSSMFSQNVVSSQLNRGNSLIGLANAAASSCLNDYRGKDVDIKAVVETTGICFVSGQLHKVSFYAVGKCRRNPCPRTFAKFVVSVYFDCDNQVISVECAK